jgi:tetratricopeptide (TPR) repeat protein
VFASSFDLEDAEQVAAGDGLDRGDVLELVVALVDHSMVHAEGEAPRRYRLLEALRVDARGRLDDATADATARRHTAHMARVAASAADLVATEGAEAAGEPLIPRRADLEAAFADALRRRDADAALDLAAGFEALHHRLGTVALAVEHGERALALGGGGAEARLRCLFWHVAMLLAELRVGDARAALEQGRELDWDDALMRTLEGQVQLYEGDLDGAEATLDGVVETLLGRREWFAAAVAAYVRGGIALARGDVEAGVARLREACAHFATCGDVCSLDGAAADLAEALALAERPDEAAATCDWALAFAPERPLGERNTHLMHEAALAAARAGRADDAARFAAEAAVAARRDPVIIGPWHAPAASGDVTLLAGDAGAARERYGEALALAAGIAARRGPSLPAGMYLLASELRLAQTAADPGAALEHARAALAHAHATGAPAAVGAALEAVRRLESAVAPG